MTSVFSTVAEHNSTKAAHGNWTIVSLDKDQLVVTATGNGVENLKNRLADNQVAFILLTLRLELEAIPDQPRNIFIHWTGPQAKGMEKVKYNQKLKDALENLTPNHGQLVAQGKTEFTEAIITQRWNPSSGSHTLN